MEKSQFQISIDNKIIEIDREIYTALLGNSIESRYRPYQRSLEVGKISFNDLIKFARKSDIPYSLFFAPLPFVKDRINRKNAILSQGVTDDLLSINSRGSVKVRDIELIIKNLQRKISLLKNNDATIGKNCVLGAIRPGYTIKEQAAFLRELIGLDLDHLKTLNKTKAFTYISTLLEKNNIFVAESTIPAYMPQPIHPDVKFSGICIKDKKVPFIFINNKDNSLSYEPEGRKVLTLVLLIVCLAKSKFRPISYKENVKDIITNNEYVLAEEILMPEEAIRGHSIDSLDDIKSYSNLYCVTPSALLMRLRRIGLIETKAAIEYSNILREEFKSLKKPRPSKPKPTTGFIKYNSKAYSGRIFDLVDGGKITRVEATQVLFQRQYISSSFFEEFRGAL